jgi:threonine dehydrogenase-like Zn-dependent dehydrogenase
MKALVKSQAAKGFGWKTFRSRSIGINDVLIRVRYAGICGTDVHIYQWDDWAQKTIQVPMAIGHEFVGEVVRSAPTSTTSSPATSSAARATSSADAAATAWPAAGISAPTPRASA